MWTLCGMGKSKWVQMVYVTWPRWPPCPYMVKTFKDLLWNEKSWWPWNLLNSIGYSSTATFVQMMTLGWPWPCLWHVFQSAYPMHSGERYRTNGHLVFNCHSKAIFEAWVKGVQVAISLIIFFLFIYIGCKLFKLFVTWNTKWASSWDYGTFRPP